MNILYVVAILLVLSWAILRAYKNTKEVVINKIEIGGKTNSILTILQLSDLHLEHISISPEQLYEELSDKDIDLIALTGDFLDRKRTIPKLEPYLKALGKLNAKYGMFAVLGNHDYVLRGENLQLLKDTLQNYGVTLLQNESKLLSANGDLVNIIGIDDFSTGRSNLRASYSHVNNGPKIVLTHDPNIVLHMKDYQYDYLMAGHFHGGQICYPKAYHLVKMGKLVRMNMIKGLHTHDGKPFYINEGLGQTGVNIRVGSRPEITLHQIALPIGKTESNPAV
ncbi:metallophosphoesterase [Bacillus sp. FJAT-27225]|uniref:metallophosphoesterase n=1 Tax=Bacillus sp. FJAT-27225 TaxID=1743144 RepID=UPI00080C2E01|nr:metallophosphoesterase [Bacillus sp. FJAT-27225]OCA85724.1 metallophosphoesterase [Bacillus sp. FJAT-27225]